ncbi:DUF932 domain-containing protein [Entomomonas moraniae]|uniref:DUF932 domain-containing protein n=1 Tax=Entomomonas moraniae TaxID=2213226 RepID=A0A3S9XF39_9GAMM|nr:DUF932 domain-containing protein [Entomomonas moraniae]AZS51044.1 DUF932 domain-containing protein [Entomomonas moraniae]
MAHQVSSMAYVGETPWHGLGSSLPSGQPIEVWADKAGMDWQIKQAPVCFVASDTTDTNNAGIIDLSRSLVDFADQKVLYRSDSQLPLSVVSSRYKVVQPLEVLEFYRDLTEQFGFELETAGVLKQGRKFWALARTGQSCVLGRQDEVNGYVLLATSCDGSLATTVTPTTVRVVCQNTLSIAVNRTVNTIKVPHNTHFNATEVKRRLNLTTGHWDEFRLMMAELTKRKVSDKEAEQFLVEVLSPTASLEDALSTDIIMNEDKGVIDNRITEVGHDSSEVGGISLLERIVRNTGNMPVAIVQASVDAIDWSKLPNGRAIKQVQQLYEGEGRGSEFASAKGTAWGLLNAVTEFVDHKRRAKNQENRLDSAWFGQGAQLKQQALSSALKLIA